MKLKEEHVRKICGTILARWAAKKLVRPKVADEVLLGKMVEEIGKDFRREEELDREVEALLEKHSREMVTSQASAHVMFQKIKERLAKERNIVL